MNTRMNLSDDILQPVQILWSEKYVCPIYVVNGKKYVGLTGEYGGYFEEVKVTDD